MRDAERFATEALPFLTARIECNVMVTVLMNIRAGLFDDRRPMFALGRGADGELGFAAFRTPPWPMLHGPLDPADAGDVIEAWLTEDPDLSGVTGPTEGTRALAEAWQARTGGRSTCRMREAMHTLSEVVDPARPATGMLRVADPGERALMVQWASAFAAEAGMIDSGEEIVASRMRTDGILVWDDGEPVSMLGLQPEVAGVVRIGPVYTPPERRRRGYAGSAVAAASRRALAAGAHTCMLFTDLANPTSNKIYAEVGYRRIGGWEEYSFT